MSNVIYLADYSAAKWNRKCAQALLETPHKSDEEMQKIREMWNRFRRSWMPPQDPTDAA